jgi:hypothetical protein
MKTADELKAMLFERVATIQSGGELTQAYEDQLRYEIALLAVILEEDIDAELWPTIEACM